MNQGTLQPVPRTRLWLRPIGAGSVRPGLRSERGNSPSGLPPGLVPAWGACVKCAGALTGAFMVLGLKYGKYRPMATDTVMKPRPPISWWQRWRATSKSAMVPFTAGNSSGTT